MKLSNQWREGEELNVPTIQCLHFISMLDLWSNIGHSLFMVETLNDVDVTLERTLFWLASHQLLYDFGQQNFAISCNMFD